MLNYDTIVRLKKRKSVTIEGVDEVESAEACAVLCNALETSCAAFVYRGDNLKLKFYEEDGALFDIIVEESYYGVRSGSCRVATTTEPTTTPTTSTAPVTTTTPTTTTTQTEAVSGSKTCEELGWTPKEATPMLCGQSVLNDRCFRDEKWSCNKAIQVCERESARLCTLNEIAADVVQGTG